MNQEYARILTVPGHAPVVHMPGRAFPGVVMQGDTLHGLFSCAAILHKHLARSDDENIREAVQTLAGQLQGSLVCYEKALEQHGFDLPYAKSVRGRLLVDEDDSPPVSGDS